MHFIESNTAIFPDPNSGTMTSINYKQIPCIVGKGNPTSETVGAVGCLYMNDDNGHLFKCISVTNGIYIWEEVTSSSVFYVDVSSNIDGSIALNTELNDIIEAYNKDFLLVCRCSYDNASGGNMEFYYLNTVINNGDGSISTFCFTNDETRTIYNILNDGTVEYTKFDNGVVLSVNGKEPDEDGNIEISTKYINVKDFGAVGDGENDDTQAIRDARDTAVDSNKSLYFPAGTYMIHGSIELWSGCEIYGDGSKTIIKKFPAVTQKVSAPSGGFTEGQVTFTVNNASPFESKIGHDCCVVLDWPNYEYGVFGKIQAVNTSEHTVTIDPYPYHISEGIVASIPDGYGSTFLSSFNYYADKVLFSTSFSVFCNHKFKYTDLSKNSIHGVYIHDLEIDGSKEEGEPSAYPLSAINLSSLVYKESIDNYRVIENPHENIRIENLNIYDSPSDGISVQSSKNVCITNCIIENAGFNGVHFGVGTDIASVVGCKLNADYCGYFDCADVGSVSLTGNHFEKCLYGIGGLDQYTLGLTITGNTFRDCSVGVCAGWIPNPEQMSYKNDYNSFYGHLSRPSSGITISDNAFYGSTQTSGSGSGTIVTRTGVGISAIGGDAFVISGNTFRNLSSAFVLYCSRYFNITNNYIRECSTALAMDVEVATNTQGAIDALSITHTLNCAFTGNTVQASAVGTSAKITIQQAKNMIVTGNVLIGNDASIIAGDDTENVLIENNIDNGGLDFANLGDISTALDTIIAMQEELIGS